MGVDVTAFLSACLEAQLKIFCSREVVDLILAHIGAEKDFYRLKRALEEIRRVQNYAQHKNFQGEAKRLLEDLEDAIKDGENVLDEFTAEKAMRPKLKAKSKMIKDELRSLLPDSDSPSSLLCNNTIKSKMKAINKRLDELAYKVLVLGLKEAATGSSTIVMETQNSVTPMVDNSRLRIKPGTNLKV